MNLYKRGNVWWLEYVADGVRHRQSCHTGNRKVAAEWMRSIDTARRMPTLDEAIAVLRTLYGDKVETETIALDAIWETYERTAKAIGRLNLTDKSITDRRNVIRALVTWISRNAAKVKTAEGITGRIAAEYAASLERDGLSAKTRQNRIGNLSSVWSVLGKVSDELKNPWTDLSPRDDGTSQSRLPFTREQEEAILVAAKEKGKDWYGVCIVARHTGLRYGDVATLEWSEIQGDVIRLKPNKTRKHGVEVAIPVVGELGEMLSSKPREGQYVFPLHAKYYGKRGKSIQKILNFREVLDAAGVQGDRYTFHSWRHTMATKLGASAVDKDTRKAILGHTTDAMAEHYDHDEHLAEKRKALEVATGA